MAGAIQCKFCILTAAEASYHCAGHYNACPCSFTATSLGRGSTVYKRVDKFLFGGNMSNLQFAIIQRPESVAVEAGQYAFQAC